MGNTPTISLLSGILHGYTGAKDEQAQRELLARKETRDSTLQYLGHMVNSPDVPTEHKQWAMQQISQLAQADITKKLPKGIGDLSTLPHVTQKSPGATQVQTMPGNTPPSGGAGGVQIPQPPGGQLGQLGAAPGAPGVGRAPNGTVNAMGQALGAAGATLPGQPAVPPMLPTPPKPATAPPGPIARPPIQIPIPPSGIVSQAPDTSQQLSPGGVPYILRPEDKLAQAQALEQSQLNVLRQRFPEKSPEDLAYFAQHGDFPQEKLTDIPPGGALYSSAQHKIVARNEEPKPGAKSGFTYEKGLIKNNATGAMLSEAEVAANPEAKAVFDAGEDETRKQEARQDLRDAKKSAEADARQQRAFANATDQKVQADAIKAAQTARPMVNILNTQADYIKSGKFTPRQDLALVVSAVRAMNPGTVRLPNTELELELKAGSYGDRFKRWADNAATGTLPDDQRKDLFGVIKDETDKTAGEAADNWQQAFGDKKPLPTHLARYGVREPASPDSSSVAHPDTHQWSASTWHRANPDGDIQAATAAAKKAGYEVVP